MKKSIRNTIRTAAAAAIIAAATLPCGAETSGKAAADGPKKRFTDREILFGSKAEIVKPTPTPVHFTPDGKLVFRRGGAHYTYAPKKGTISEYDYTKPISATTFPHTVKGWQNPSWSPDSTLIAYTLNGDLFTVTVADGTVNRLTFDGGDLILNGYASWVYYEEILGRASRYKAYWWSPDSRTIAFYRFDNGKVPMFPIYDSKGQHGSLQRTRYPKAGDPNPEVKVGFVPATGGETVWADFDPALDQYFGIPFWSGDGERFMVAWMPRSQDDLELFSVDPATGGKVSVYKEHQECWIDWMEEMLFSDEGIYIVRDGSGWQQIYFLSYDGKRLEQLTEGRNWSVNLLKVSKNFLFFTSKGEDPTRVDIYRISLKEKKTERISDGPWSWTSVVISDDDSHIAAICSNARTPFKLMYRTLPKAGRKLTGEWKTIFDTKGADFDDYELALPETLCYTTRDGLEIPMQVTWPLDMEPGRKYPVKVSLYGGPDSPRVRDSWGGYSQWWAQHGVIQVTLDNRAGGSHGKRVLEQIYRRLGVVEAEDFIDGLKYFTALPCVNPEKTGVEGFSFGGTMTTILVTEGSDYYKYGIAGGGVYDWSLYDSHYTERYMDTPQDNPDGYAASRVLDRLGKYKGDRSNMLRITHGTGDDNVHYQNSLQLINKLQGMHRDFELMFYPEALHGYRGDQQIHSRLQDYKFWYRYLLEEEVPEIIVECYGKKGNK